jgi:hypothetical protein
MLGQRRMNSDTVQQAQSKVNNNAKADNSTPFREISVTVRYATRVGCEHDDCPARNTVFARSRVLDWSWWTENLARTFSWPRTISVWATLKGTLYQDVPAKPENTRQHVIVECAAMNPQVNEWERQWFIQRLQLYMKFNGQHFEHLCWLRTPSYSFRLVFKICDFCCILLRSVIIRIVLCDNSFDLAKKKKGCHLKKYWAVP